MKEKVLVVSTNGQVAVTNLSFEEISEIIENAIANKEIASKDKHDADKVEVSEKELRESVDEFCFAMFSTPKICTRVLGKELETGNKDSGGRKEYYQVLPDSEKSGMYYGRKVIYVIPQRYPSGDYYITLKMLVNNYTTSSKTVDESGIVTYKSLLTADAHATTGHHAYIKIANSDIAASSKDSSGNPIFTPWIRATIHVKSVADVENIVKFTSPAAYN